MIHHRLVAGQRLEHIAVREGHHGLPRVREGLFRVTEAGIIAGGVQPREIVVCPGQIRIQAQCFLKTSDRLQRC